MPIDLTPLITFRPLDKKHLEWARLLHNDPEVLAMLTDPTIISKQQQSKWFRRLKHSKTSERWLVLIGQEPVGLIRLDEIDRNNHSLCIGMDISKPYRGKGYAKPIYQALISHLFNDGFHRLWLLVADFNRRAKQIYLDIGFQMEGVRRQALYRGNEYKDYLMMSLLRQEWKQEQ